MSDTDKMFEELGYKKIEGSEYYNKHYVEYKRDDTVIEFWKDEEMINISNIIGMQELKAINYMCKELGFIL